MHKFNEKRVLGELLTNIGVLSEAAQVLDDLKNGDADRKAEIIDKYDLELRICSVCGALMDEGWLEEDCSLTYCSKECVMKGHDWSEEDFKEWESEWTDSDGLFWTQWY